MKGFGLLIALLTVVGQVNAQQNTSFLSTDVITINDQVVEQNFMLNQLEYYLDASNTVTFDVISSKDFSHKFQRYPAYQNKDFKANTSYWIRLPILHNQSSKKVW